VRFHLLAWLRRLVEQFQQSLWGGVAFWHQAPSAPPLSQSLSASSAGVGDL
jgi:hypothetical protein